MIENFKIVPQALDRSGEIFAGVASDAVDTLGRGIRRVDESWRTQAALMLSLLATTEVVAGFHQAGLTTPLHAAVPVEVPDTVVTHQKKSQPSTSDDVLSLLDPPMTDEQLIETWGPGQPEAPTTLTTLAALPNTTS